MKGTLRAVGLNELFGGVLAGNRSPLVKHPLGNRHNNCLLKSKQGVTNEEPRFYVLLENQHPSFWSWTSKILDILSLTAQRGGFFDEIPKM
jgi:hypothetical protein